MSVFVSICEKCVLISLKCSWLLVVICEAPEEVRSALTPGARHQGPKQMTIKWPVGGGLGTGRQPRPPHEDKRRAEVMAQRTETERVRVTAATTPLWCLGHLRKVPVLVTVTLETLKTVGQTHGEEEAREEWAVSHSHLEADGLPVWVLQRCTVISYITASDYWRQNNW